MAPRLVAGADVDVRRLRSAKLSGVEGRSATTAALLRRLAVAKLAIPFPGRRLVDRNGSRGMSASKTLSLRENADATRRASALPAKIVREYSGSNLIEAKMIMIIKPIFALVRSSLLITWLVLQAIPMYSATLKKIAVIELPGPRGEHFDHLVMDYDDHYLLSAHLGPGILYVIDTRKNTLIEVIPGLPGITAPVYVPRLRKVYTCDWGENKIGVISLATMRVQKKLPTREKPNGGVYAEPFGKVYISDTLGEEVAVVDVHNDTVIKELKFDGETGMVQFDPVGRKVLVNLRTTDKVAEVDPASDTIMGQYSAGRCDFNHGMALDAASRRAFLLCGGNNRLAVFNVNTHRSIAYIPLPPESDDVQFDPGLRRIYVACETGMISVIHEIDANHYVKLEDFPVPRGVHTLAVDAGTHRVYAPEQEENGRPVARMLVFQAVGKGTIP